MKNLNLRGLLALAIATVFISACTRQNEGTSNLTIQLPSIQNQSLKSDFFQSVTLASGNSPWSGSSSAQSDINCYVVMVGGPVPDLQKNSCSKKDTSEKTISFGPIVGGVPAGQSISINVPAGPSRKIYLLGTKASTGGCINFMTNGPPSGLNTYPRILTSSTVDLQPGSKTVSLVVPSSISSLTEIDSCTFANGGGTGGGQQQSPFGDGRDGDMTVPNVGLDFSVDDHAHPSISFAAATVSSSKKLSSARKITNVAVNGLTITVSSSFTPDDFEVGDEVMWIVNAAYDSGGPDNACGGGLYRGSWGTAKILAIPMNTMMELDSPISTSANNTALSDANINSSGATHCKMQILRVPNFKKISFTTGNPAFFTGSYSFSSATGGILAFRASEIEVGSGSSVNSTFHATGKGFSPLGNTSGGGTTGEYPTPSVAAANSTGGAFYGGGGAHNGGGGNGPNSGGSPITYCIGSTPCQAGRDKKAFFGGAGGSPSAGVAGGAGGGIVFVFAKRIYGHPSSNFKVESKGSGAWANPGTGGGAGGSVLLVSKQIDLAGTQLTLNSIGESRSGYTNSGGGGGGGVEVLLCQQASVPLIATILSVADVTGGLGGSGASPGSPGEKIVNDSPALCAIP